MNKDFEISKIIMTFIGFAILGASIYNSILIHVRDEITRNQLVWELFIIYLAMWILIPISVFFSLKGYCSNFKGNQKKYIFGFFYLGTVLYFLIIFGIYFFNPF